jgi:site-specific recombinase XerD
MTALAPLLEAFFAERLQRQLKASSHTVAAYRDAFRLLLAFAERRTGKTPSNLLLADIDAPLVSAFLDHLERERGNSVRTRNARFAAIRSFFRFASFREPAHAGLIQRVLAMPQKRFDRNLVAFLTAAEVHALLSAPDTSTRLGRRDYALLLLAVQTGLRLAELTSLRVEDLILGPSARVRCQGKGRKERCTPLSRACARVLRAWITESGATSATDLLFRGMRGARLSHDAVERLVAKYASQAAGKCPTLARKRVTPHVLRHTTAVQLLEAGVDRAVIALWLGHEQVETTQIYLDADLATKERALARTASHGARRGRYQPKDSLLAFLEGL